MSIDYAWSTGETGSSFTLTAANYPGEVLTCTATADDGDGGTDVAAASATVESTPPTSMGAR